MSTPTQSTFNGRVSITVEVPARTRVASFELHGEGLTILDASMLRRKGRAQRFPVKVSAIAGSRLSVTAPKPLRPGRYSLDIVYEAPLHTQPYGLYRFEAGGKAYVVSQFEADDARTAWPCFDEPRFKIPWKFVVTTPFGNEVISNANVGSVSGVGPGDRLVEFGWTPPVPSYALAMAVGPYVGTPVTEMDVPSSIWTVQGRQSVAPSLVAELPAVTAWLEDWFGSPYPYEKLDFIAVPRFAFGAMENPGAVVIREEFLFSPETRSDRRRRNLIMVTAHEVAHMWFGDLVTLQWWDDFWLNEAFASWMGLNTLHALAPEYREEVARVSRLKRMIERDGVATSRPLRTEVDPAAVFETVNFAAYDKGAAILDMTQSWLHPTVFRRGLSTYIDRHAWKNANYNDLFASLEEVSNLPVGRVLKPYLTKPGAPHLAFTSKGDGTWAVAQSRYGLLGQTVAGGPWTVPLRVRVGRADNSSDVMEVLLDSSATSLELGESRWILPVADGTGYFAWSLDDTSMEALLSALPTLSPSERRAVLAAMELQVSSGQIEVAELLEALGAFDSETDPAILRSVTQVADLVRVVEQLEDPALEARMWRWMRTTLKPKLDALGLAAVDDEDAETQVVRLELLARLADASDRQVRAYGKEVGRNWLNDAMSAELSLGQWGLNELAREGDWALYEELIGRAESTEDPGERRRMLSAAAMVPGDRVRDAALARVLAPETGPGGIASLVTGLVRTRNEDAELTFFQAWVIDNYEALSAKLSPVFRGRLAQFGVGCSAERLEIARTFFADPARRVSDTERILAETEQAVRTCKVRRERHGASVRAFLKAWKG